MIVVSGMVTEGVRRFGKEGDSGKSTVIRHPRV